MGEEILDGGGGGGGERVGGEAFSLFRFHLSPFPRKRLILRLEFCPFHCSDAMEDLCMKQFWSVFPDGFLENFTEV